MNTTERTLHIVDDDHAVLDSLALFARTAGLEPYTYPSAEHFLRGYRRAARECLLLDLRMPGMSGVELQAELARRQIKVPMVVLTGHGDVHTAVQAMKNGAVDFVEKPFEAAVLLECLERCYDEDLRRRRSAGHAEHYRALLDQLSQREGEVLELIADGLSAKEIGERLAISPRTVEIHRAHIKSKMKARNSAEMVRIVLSAQSATADAE